MPTELKENKANINFKVGIFINICNALHTMVNKYFAKNAIESKKLAKFVLVQDNGTRSFIR